MPVPLLGRELALLEWRVALPFRVWGSLHSVGLGLPLFLGVGVGPSGRGWPGPAKRKGRGGPGPDSTREEGQARPAQKGRRGGLYVFHQNSYNNYFSKLEFCGAMGHRNY